MWRPTEYLGALTTSLALLIGGLSSATAAVRGSLPDLSVEAITVNARCQVVVKLKNRGPGALPDSAWAVDPRRGVILKIQSGADRPRTARLPGVDPQKRLQRAGAQLTWVSGVRVDGRATIRAEIDAGNRVREINERNNVREQVLRCAAAPGNRTRVPTTPPPSPSPSPASPPASPTPPTQDGSLLDTAVPDAPAAPQSPAAETPAEYEPGELLVFSTDMNAARALAREASALGMRVKRRRVLKGLGQVITVLGLPADMSVPQARDALREAVPTQIIDANHRYRLQADDAVERYPRRLLGWPVSSTGCGRNMRIGLVDTGVARQHPGLRGARITERHFVTTGRTRAGREHGTAVATLLLGQGAGGLDGMLPEAQLYVAAVFRRRADEVVDTSAEWLAFALDWLVSEKVRVINLSLGGPRNRPLEAVIVRVLKKGITVVAAAGNGGEDGAPVYPAAQPGVIAVTAVDAAVRLWPRATRGEYIDFAAPGVEVWTARADGGAGFVSGTSYATPFVTAALAVLRQQGRNGSAALQELQRQARDLGRPGRDRETGWGLIRLTPACN